MSQLQRLLRVRFKFRGELQPKNLGLEDEVFEATRRREKLPEKA